MLAVVMKDGREIKMVLMEKLSCGEVVLGGLVVNSSNS